MQYPKGNYSNCLRGKVISGKYLVIFNSAAGGFFKVVLASSAPPIMHHFPAPLCFQRLLEGRRLARARQSLILQSSKWKRDVELAPNRWFGLLERCGFALPAGPSLASRPSTPPRLHFHWGAYTRRHQNGRCEGIAPPTPPCTWSRTKGIAATSPPRHCFQRGAAGIARPDTGGAGGLRGGAPVPPNPRLSPSRRDLPRVRRKQEKPLWPFNCHSANTPCRPPPTPLLCTGGSFA